MSASWVAALRRKPPITPGIASGRFMSQLIASAGRPPKLSSASPASAMLVQATLSRKLRPTCVPPRPRCSNSTRGV
jgi:hypothetical protein